MTLLAPPRSHRFLSQILLSLFLALTSKTHPPFLKPHWKEAPTCGNESMLWPRSLTTVSEELEVDELISLTTKPGAGARNGKGGRQG